MAKQKNNKFLNFLTTLIVLFLLIGIIGAIVYFTGIGKSITGQFGEFRVAYDGQTYKQADTENVLSVSNTGLARFDVGGTDNYTVKIVPNVTDETDFTYTVGDNTYYFGGESDLTYCFAIEAYEGYFVIDCDNDYSVTGILSHVWGSDDISVDGALPSHPYKMVVSNSSGGRIELELCFVSDEDISITLSQTQIVF